MFYFTNASGQIVRDRTSITPQRQRKISNYIENLPHIDDAQVLFTTDDGKYNPLTAEDYIQSELLTPNELYNRIIDKNDGYIYIKYIHIFFDRDYTQKTAGYIANVIKDAWKTFFYILNVIKINVDDALRYVLMTMYQPLSGKKIPSDNKMDFNMYRQMATNHITSKHIDIIKYFGYILDIDVKDNEIKKTLNVCPKNIPAAVFYALQNAGLPYNTINKLKVDVKQNLGRLYIIIPEDTVVSFDDVHIMTLVGELKNIEKVKITVHGTLVIDDIAGYDNLRFIDMTSPRNRLVINCPITKRLMDRISLLEFNDVKVIDTQ